MYISVIIRIVSRTTTTSKIDLFVTIVSSCVNFLKPPILQLKMNAITWLLTVSTKSSILDVDTLEMSKMNLFVELFNNSMKELIFSKD